MSAITSLVSLKPGQVLLPNGDILDGFSGTTIKASTSSTPNALQKYGAIAWPLLGVLPGFANPFAAAKNAVEDVFDVDVDAPSKSGVPQDPPREWTVTMVVVVSLIVVLAWRNFGKK